MSISARVFAACVMVVAVLGNDARARYEQAASVAAQSAQLIVGVPIEGSFGAGETAYRLALLAGDALEAQVTQDGGDVRLRLTDPGGNEVTRADMRRPIHGAERLTAVAGEDGVHLLHVEPVGAQPADAIRFVVTLNTRGPATDRDRTFAEAAAAYAQAVSDAAKGTAESIQSALTASQRALDAWRKVGAPFEEAAALHRLGLTYMQSSRLHEASRVFNEAARIRRDINDRHGEGMALNNLAATFNRLGEYEAAEAAYGQALPIRREVGDREGEAFSLTGLALVRAIRTEGWSSALDLFEQARVIGRAIGDARTEAEALYYLGYGRKQINQFDVALTHFEASLALRRQRNDLAGQASALNQIAAVHLQLGDPQRGLELLDDVLALRQRAGDKRGEAYTLETSGIALIDLGDYDKAMARLSEALELFDTIGDREGQTGALAYLARARLATGDAPRAHELAQRAIGVLEGERNLMTPIVWALRGDAELMLERPDQATTSYRSSLDEARRIDQPLSAARAYTGLGRSAQTRGQLAEAQTYLSEAMALIEGVRAGVARQDWRTSFLASIQGTYESSIDVLMQLHREQPSAGYAAAALAVSERRRARTLIELLAEARADVRSSADPILLEREETLQARLNDRSAQLQALGDHATVNARDDLDKEINELVAELRTVRGQLGATSAQHASLVHPSPLDLAQIQQLLDRDTLLVEYSLGRDRSFVWAITPNTLTVQELPGRAAIEAAAQHARELIGESGQRAVRVPLRRALADLSAMILGPVADELGEKRLVIVADGALQYVPFAALPLPTPSQPGADADPLIVRHEIVVLPSASTVGLLSRDTQQRSTAPFDPSTFRQAQGRPEHSRGTTSSWSPRAQSRGDSAQGKLKTVAVLADPVLQRDDPRVALTKRAPHSETQSANAAVSRDLTRAAVNVGLARFERLPHSRDEANAITALAGASASVAALGFDASRDFAISPEFARFRIVHFATHTMLDTRHPELSGIVLSLVDPNGQPVDGFLRLHDIFNLRLSADLVVLSACETALGRDVKGEGLIGLTRGFMYAGASQVVASLWNVRDRATAELMKRFYTGLLEQRMTPAAALRAAQVSMWKDPKWRMPVYWSGFIVQGDWRTR